MKNLNPWQKEVFRRIQKYDELYIVKSRQIGASTFLRKLAKEYNGEVYLTSFWSEKIENVYCDVLNTNSPPPAKVFDLAIYDEFDYFREFNPVRAKKHIFCSTPNTEGLLKSMVENAAPEKVLRVNYAWSPKICEEIENIKRHLNNNQFEQEYLCKL